MPPLLSARIRPMDSLAEVVRLYERHGFPSQFAARPGGNVRCLACHRDHPARWMRLLALHRLEGMDRPRNVAIAAVECPACEERGTLALATGALGPVEDRLVLSLLDSPLGGSVVPAGIPIAS